MTDDELALAEAVRNACIQAALQAWEDAGIRGICGEGRWELAVDAMRKVDLGDPYRPIDCGLHDRLEAWCVTRQRCGIRFTTGPGAEHRVDALIDDVFAAGGEEFLLLDNGERIRLDRIVDIRPSAPPQE